jgi:hypothetical protein
VEYVLQCEMGNEVVPGMRGVYSYITPRIRASNRSLSS